uniref:Histidine biosynthesis bifunctional protein hisIE, chloroplastic isoform X1 n=1 Tax=Tanacetum cinerariifolium TaxID=118510 RepID=A0A6L2ND88_TANCI|nr:histidine biosynthesis bifunctional protein hisIE, chloroplastic isoform X1 [Tanacetum cinerariifolium]
MAFVNFHGLRSLQISSRECVFNPSGPIQIDTSNNKSFAIKACAKKPDQSIHIESKIIYLGKPDGPTCHTGAETCYYTSIFDSVNKPEVEESVLSLIRVKECSPMIVEDFASWVKGTSTWVCWGRGVGIVWVSEGAQEVLWGTKGE